MKEIIYNNKRFKPVSFSEYTELTTKENIFKAIRKDLSNSEIELCGGVEQIYFDILDRNIIDDFMFDLSFIHLWPILRRQNTFTEEVCLFDYLGTI